MGLLRKQSPKAGRQRERVRSRATGGDVPSRRPEPAYSSTGRQSRNDKSSKTLTELIKFSSKRLGLIVLLVAVVLSVVNLLSLSMSAKVVPLTTNSNEAFLRPMSIYKDAADKALSGSIWNHNKVTVDTNKISQSLLSEFPELASVSVTLPFFSHRPVVYVQPADPALILLTRSGAFVVDANGKALIRSNSDLGSSAHQLNVPIVNDESGIDIELKQQALSAKSVAFIQEVLAQLKAKHYSAQTLTLPAATSELDIKLAEQPYLVKFNLHSNNPRGQVGTLLASIATLKRHNIVPSQYIDVRVDGRAYYK